MVVDVLFLWWFSWVLCALLLYLLLYIRVCLLLALITMSSHFDFQNSDVWFSAIGVFLWLPTNSGLLFVSNDGKYYSFTASH
jgi:hypothetical protein